MEFKKLCLVFVIINVAHGRIGFKRPNTAFDQALYEEVLDPEQCDRQVRYLASDLFLNLRFIDAGIRLPKGILTGNTVDLGNYYQCLGIDELREELEIKGKYCMIGIPLNQTIDLPGMKGVSQFESLFLDDMKLMEGYETVQTTVKALNGDFERSSIPDSPLSSLMLHIAVCIPRPCSVEQAMTSALYNLTSLGFEFEELFCRLPYDKPWSPADYVVVVLLSLIGFLTVLCTCYDLNHIFFQRRDPKQASELYRSFSLYTNGKRLMTFSSNPNSLHCLDGIRSLAMLWVIIGHGFITENFFYNVIEGFEWRLSAQALWLTVAPFTVDTFFMLTGLLLVYTTAGKLTGQLLLQKLHLFYLNRLLRLFPLLALTVLLQASLLNIMFDGPYWESVANHVQRCREHWWATLLHVQNYATPSTMCITHSWYVAIDVHLHIVSPLVLYWVLSKSKRTAWIALTAALAVIYASTTYYNTINDFPGYNIVPNRDTGTYMINFYFNSFTRAAPFFVGMVFGYILNIWKGKKPKIHSILVLLLWACTFAIFGLIVYFVYRVKQVSWNYPVMDVIMNTYGRSAWALALGWLIFACVHGYGGPINWFLSLDLWKLPSRLSYAMFLLHYPFQFTINSTQIAPVYFSVPAFAFKFLAYATFTLIVSFFACLVIDGPFSILVKLMLGDGVKKQKSPVKPLNNGVKKTTEETCKENTKTSESVIKNRILHGKPENGVVTETKSEPQKEDSNKNKSVKLNESTTVDKFDNDITECVETGETEENVDKIEVIEANDITLVVQPENNVVTINEIPLSEENSAEANELKDTKDS